MDATIGAIPKMDWESGDLVAAWKSFKQHTEFMFRGPLLKKTAEEKCNYLMLWVGDKGRDLYSTWELSDDDKKKLDTYYKKFQDYVEPKTNKVFARYQFQCKVQSPEETGEQFITSLRMLVKSCGYNDPDDMIRDRIVFGVNSNKVREKLINQGSELTLEKAIDILRLHEIAQKQLKMMSEEDPTVTTKSEVNAVHSLRMTARPREAVKKYNTEKYSRPNQKSQSSSSRGKCGRCGRAVHSRGERCPAIGKQCNRCSKMNHFECVCRTKLELNTVYENDYDPQIGYYDDEAGLFIGMIHVVQSIDDDDEWSEKVFCNGVSVTFQLDTGAKCNTLPESMLKSLNSPPVQLGPRSYLKSYSNHKIPTAGTVTLPCQFRGTSQTLIFQIVQLDAVPVLGAKACKQLGLVQRVNVVDNPSVKNELEDIIDQETHKQLFVGLGCLPNMHTIKLDPAVQPVVHPPRRVPVSLRDRVKTELQRMEQMGVIVKQTEPTEWVNSMVTVVKPGKVRICIDPKDLNRAIKREHFPMKTVDEVVSNMTGAKVFSKLDATSGFWQIRLDEESSRLCTFNSPFGRYRFTRLPFGIKSAPEVYQRIMSQMVEDIEGAEAIMDDILIWGVDRTQHDERLKKVLDRVLEYNLKLNLEKCEFRKNEVKYMGHVLSHGLKIDPEKVRAVLSMPVPENKPDLQTFLGFVQYLGKFMPNMSAVSAPLRKLVEQDSEWIWSDEQNASFETLRQMASNAPVLRYYDPALPLTLSVDASSKGLGAVILQNGQPIAYASRALTAAQQNYAQIEKETLAVVFGCTKFHDYCYARRVEVETDHKPLQAIFNKPLYQAPSRLQRFLLAVQKYDLHVTYKPGKFMWLADTLSRAYLKETPSDLIVDEAEVNMIHPRNFLPVSKEKYELFQTETAKDSVLTELQQVVQSGWPDHKDNIPVTLREYWNFRDEIICIDGLLYKGAKLIVPKALHSSMLDKIHESHLGIVKCKARAREVFYWPGMSSQIEDIVARCTVCAEHAKGNNKEPMIPVDIPDRPWAKVAVDLFELNHKHYMITVDYFSKWPEVVKLDNLTTNNVVCYLKSQFSRYGLPDVLISDNGPQFSSHEFKNFLADYGIEHSTSSPYYAQANGQAERTVQTVKHLLSKAKDPYKALMDYRSSPLDIGKSPAQLFLNRRLKTTLPTAAELLKPEVVGDDIHVQLRKRHEIQKHYYDKRAGSELPVLKEKDTVMMRSRDGSGWTRATVVSNHHNPRSYVVQTADGTNYRRNRYHLRPTKCPPSSQTVQPPASPLLRSTRRSSSPLHANPPPIPCAHSPRQTHVTRPPTPPQPSETITRTRYGRMVKVPVSYPN